jgi:hypothetical protein
LCVSVTSCVCVFVRRRETVDAGRVADKGWVDAHGPGTRAMKSCAFAALRRS